MYNNIVAPSNSYMFRAFLAHHHGVDKLYTTTEWYTGLLNVEELLKIRRYIIYSGPNGAQSAGVALDMMEVFMLN